MRPIASWSFAYALSASGVRRLAAMTAAAAGVAAAPVGALAQTPSVPAGEVTAAGTASVAVQPDMAIITVQYSASARTPALAGRDAARRANAIRAAIVAVGIPADSLPTTAGQAGWWGSWGNRSSIQVRNDMKDTVYVTNDAFLVRVHDLALVGRVIDTALAQGAQTISNVEFQATNTQAARLAAIRAATADARAQARAVAEASGLVLGRTVRVDVAAPPGPISLARAAMTEGLAFSRADVSTTVVAPELRVQVSVSGTWQMVAGRPR